MPDTSRGWGSGWGRTVKVVGALVGVVAAAIGFRAASSRLFPDGRSQALQAYHRGDFSATADLVREQLKARPDDSETLRLMARTAAQLGRDDSAINLYTRRIPKTELQPEDLVLLGHAFARKGQTDVSLKAWKDAISAEGPLTPECLEELSRRLTQGHLFEPASKAAERLSRESGWEARGHMMLGAARASLNDVPGAAEAFRKAMAHDPNEFDHSANPPAFRKLVARTFLKSSNPADALPLLNTVLAAGPDAEASWLKSRAHLQEGKITEAKDAFALSNSFRVDNPLEPEPSPYVGEAKCARCHANIFKNSLTSRHTQSFYRGDEIKKLPRPDHPLPDPDDPKVTHAIVERDGVVEEETRVGDTVYRAVVEYAFGTTDRYVTSVHRDANGGYRIARMSWYCSPEGSGWDYSALDNITATKGDQFQGQPVGIRDGVIKCLYCHTTNPRAGRERVGPETGDRAIGCERCHGPGGNHIAAVEARFPDLAISNPGPGSSATPQAVSETQCNDCHILGQKTTTLAEYEEVQTSLRSQGLGWGLSRCKTESKGAFGCVTCHEPHSPARTTTTAQYEAKCLACHSSVSKTLEINTSPTVCPVNPAKGCLGCHMPRISSSALHAEVTDHFIRVRRTKAVNR